MSKKIHIVSILLLLFSCTLKKTSQNTLKIEPLSTNNLLDSIDKTSLNFNTLKNRASATLFFNGEKNSVKVNFRIQKDSLIWANLSKSGIQLLTSLLSEDSIKFLKKVNKKEYFFGNYTDLESIVNSTLNYQMVEDFICGNPVLIKNKDTYFYSVNSGCHLLSSIKPKKIDKVLSGQRPNDEKIIYRYWFSPWNFKCTKVEINFIAQNRTIVSKYSNWKKFNSGLFPMNTEMVLYNPTDTISIALEYGPSLKFNTALSFPLKKSHHYTKINLAVDE